MGGGWEKLTIVESDESLILIIETLESVGRSLGEVPDISLLESIDSVVSVLIDSGNNETAGIDVTPLGLYALVSTADEERVRE